MEIHPILLAVYAEAGILILVLLIYSIRQAIVARRALKAKVQEYDELADEHAAVVEKQQALEEDEHTNSDLIRETIALIHQQYKESGHPELGSDQMETFDHTAESASLILAYQVLVAQLNAIDNQKSAEDAWKNIDDHLQPIIGDLFSGPKTTNADEPEDDAEEGQDATSSPDKLQEKVNELTKYIEELEQAAAINREQNAERDVHASTIENYKTQVAELNQTITALKQTRSGGLAEGEVKRFCDTLIELAASESHGDIQPFVQEFMVNREQSSAASNTGISRTSDTQLLKQGLKNTENEIAELTSKISSQHDTIRQLELKLAKGEESSTIDPEVDRYVSALKQNLKDSEMCIETMEMEIKSAQEEIDSLKSELDQLVQQLMAGAGDDSKDEQAAAEMNQMRDCIAVLEDTSDQQIAEISELKAKLEKSESLRETLQKQLESGQSSDPDEPPNDPES